MKLKRILVENYRGLKKIDLPLSNFACIIGENNAGKSSVLQALSLFFTGSPLTHADYFNPATDIRIEVEFTQIKEEDIERLEEQHRDKVREMMKDDALVLCRRYSTDGKSKLKRVTMVPKEDRFSAESIAALTKNQRAGTAFRQALTAAFPEIANSFTTTTGVGEARELILRFGDSFPDEEKQKEDVDLPAGLDVKEKGIFHMLPEPIYIQAVKDLADDTKTQEKTPFGKVLSVLLRAIEDKLNAETDIFQILKAKLNRIEKDDGTFEDNRLPEVQMIEKMVEEYIQESFSNISLNISIPPPEVKTILSGAQIFVNDGVEGLIDTKGDGLRRAVVFAIMRAYVDLGKMEEFADAQLKKGNYLLLFEEPELYLHPKAQDILFKALSTFSKHHHVLVTTHSPRFFGPNATATFIKMKKLFDTSIAEKPFATALQVDLDDMTAKNQFQLICYENNNAAFFSDTVVLVEGDSDFILFPHIAKTIDPNWDSTKTSVSFARINGKGSIKRYREFFSRFNVRVPVISDLDLIVSGFDHIEPSDELRNLREKLIKEIDKELEATEESEPSGKAVSKARDSGEIRAIWRKAKEIKAALDQGKATWEELDATVDAFFAWEGNKSRLWALENPPSKLIEELKLELLAKLRTVDVYVLSRGAVEAYYPQEITGSDKPSKALCFCNTICTKDAVLACCEAVPVEDGHKLNEFYVISHAIFSNKN